MNKSQLSIKLLNSNMESKTKTHQHFQEMQRNTVWTKDFTSGQPVLLEKENGTSLQYSCLENSVDREAWRATVHRAAKSQTWLNIHTHKLSFNYELQFNQHFYGDFNYNVVIISMMIPSSTFLNLVNLFDISLFLCPLDTYCFCISIISQ